MSEIDCSKTEQTIDIVQKWSDEHPVKTRLDDLKLKYPNAPMNERGTPNFNPDLLGYCRDCKTCKRYPVRYGCWHELLDGGATGKAVE